jgi:hypothetical protein
VGHKYGGLVLQVEGWVLDYQSSPVNRLLLRNPKRGDQGPTWAVEPYDDDDDDDDDDDAYVYILS